MRVLSDFVSTDLSEDQLLPLSNVMLPQLLRILGDVRVSSTIDDALPKADTSGFVKYSAVTRAQSVSIFNQCISTLYMVQESHPQAAKYATQQVLPEWASAFEQILSSDPVSDGTWSSLHIRAEIFTVSLILIRENGFPPSNALINPPDPRYNSDLVPKKYRRPYASLCRSSRQTFDYAGRTFPKFCFER